MEKDKGFRKELYRVCRLCDFLPPKFLEDSLVFWVSKELDKAREEGRREALEEVMSWDSMQDMLPILNDYLNELSKLKDNK